MPGRPTAEQIFRGLLRGPLTTRTSSTPPAGPGTAWAGQLLMGAATASVATTLVDSDSLVLVTTVTGVSSVGPRMVMVTSISPGSGFFLSTADAGIPAVTYIVNWMLVRTQ